MKIAMFKSTLIAAFMLVLFSANMMDSVEGLAFVVARIVNPIAALKALGSSRESASALRSQHTDSMRPILPQDIAVVQTMTKPHDFSHDDDTIRNHRSAIVDLVYERSLERMNGFNGQS